MSAKGSTATVLNFNAAPQPLWKLKPQIVFILFCFLLTCCSGPAYNQNCLKRILQASGWFAALDSIDSGLPSTKSDELLRRGFKLFQSCDIFLGFLVGYILDTYGPRVSNVLGYSAHALGVFGMMFPRTFVVAMALQGLSSVCVLTSAMHLVNLFPHGGKAAMCLLSGVVDLALLLYPIFGVLIAEWSFIQPDIIIYFGVSVAVCGIILSFLLMGDTPFLPLQAKADAGMLVITGVPDARDVWYDESRVDRGPRNKCDDGDVNCNFSSPLSLSVSTSTVGEYAGSFSADLRIMDPELGNQNFSRIKSGSSITNAREEEYEPLIQGARILRTPVCAATEQPQPMRRESEETSVKEHRHIPAEEHLQVPNLATSVISVADVRSTATALKDSESLFLQLLSPEWLLITLYFSLCVVRNNLFFDGNEVVLQQLGDEDGLYVKTFEMLLPVSFLFSLVVGVIMEQAGTVAAMCFMNAASLLVHFFSSIKWLGVQRVTFGLFYLARCACFSGMFTYSCEIFSIQRIGVLTGCTGLVAGIVNQVVGSKVNDYVDSQAPAAWFDVHFVLMICSGVAFVPLGILMLFEKSQKHFAGV